jgi:serine/threonine protein kinase
MIAQRSQQMEGFVEERIGQTLGGRWALQSVLGVGGMAAVYAATDPAGTEAAVKILHPEIGMRRELRERFMREGSVANRIQHPGVVRVLEHGAVDDRSAFLVLERLHGESLGDRVARGGMLPLPDLLDVLDQVLDVLAVAHDAGIVHRDLKPDNLFLTEDGPIKVLDFGIARVLETAPDDLRTRTGMAMGTVPYMAPEQALGKRSEIDGRADLFALGATAFRILARRRVHEADSEAGMLVAMASKPAPPLRSVAEQVPENVAIVIDLALAFHRDARYPDARTMQRDVRAVQRAEPPPFATQKLRLRDEPTRAPQHAPVPIIVHAPTVQAAIHRPTPGPVAATAVGTREAPPVSMASTEPMSATSAAPGTPEPDATRAKPLHLSPLQLAMGALGCLLFGALLWAVWPGSEQPASEQATVDEPASEGPRSTTAEQQRDREPAKKSREATREYEKKQQELAREQQKKLEEFSRERAKKASERRREKEKR